VARVELQPFADDHLDAAGRLLADRHRRHRAVEPLLPAQFESADAARQEVEGAWRKDGAAGAAAFRAARLVGYLVGAPGDEAVWGPNVWVELAGQAAEEAEIVRDLYAAVAERWVDEGRTRHYVLAPATGPDVLEAWSRLSFGQQHAMGIREVPAEPWPEGVRRAELRDVDALVELAPLLAGHQVLAPTFSGRPLTLDEDELRDEIAKDIDSDEIANLVAEVDGRIVGNFELVPVERSSMHVGLARPERASFLAFAVTDPGVRGSGAGLALTQAALAWSHEAGYPTMVTDWRMTNLLSSRFWPRRGFRTSFLRLYRSIP
jgi:GNAT superfamily N-acetyltransferase